MIPVTIDDGVMSGRQLFGYVNISTAWTMGGEFAARVRPVKGLRLEASYSLTATEDVELERPLEGVESLQDPQFAVVPPRRRSARPPHRAAARVYGPAAFGGCRAGQGVRLVYRV